jgi:hypothetical protein
MSNTSAAPRFARRASVLSLALSLALLGGASHASAQSGHLVQIGYNQNPGLSMVSPRSGTIGSTIKIGTKSLPPNTAVQIMIGALMDGFEVVATPMTDGNGLFDGRDTVEIKVPDWVKTNRSYLVMLTTLDYKPLAAADMFHPTDANGGLSRRGTVKFDDPKCPTLIGQGGELYFLTGSTAGLMGGDDVVIKGTVVGPTACGPTTTIKIDSFKPAGI